MFDFVTFESLGYDVILLSGNVMWCLWFVCVKISMETAISEGISGLVSEKGG